MGQELTEALECTRISSKILKEINNTFIALIPKKEKATHLGDFRPISLCNTVYKILSKVMINRMKPLMDSIISEEQIGFVPGRSILDGVIVAQEVINTLQSTNRPGMIIKLDILKARDNVDWRFLCKIMQAFGFAKQWINWVYECISTPKFSILINGKPPGFFSSSRGI